MAAASIFSAAVPLMAASGVSDYVLKVSGINRINDGIKYSSSADLASGRHTLSFDVCAVSGSETLILFITDSMSSSNLYNKSFTFGESWQTVEYTFDTTGTEDGYFDDFTFELISWCTDDDHDYYIKNITLTESGSDINLLTGTTYPLDFIDCRSAFTPISRDASKESNSTLSYVTIGEIVTVGNASGYFLYSNRRYSENLGIDEDPNFTVATPGTVIHKTALDSGVSDFFYSNTVQMDIEKYCTYRIKFFLQGHADHAYSVDLFPSNLGSVTFTDSLPTHYSEFDDTFNSSGDNYVSHIDVTYTKDVTMADYSEFASDGLVDTFTFEYVFSTADGFIDNVDPGTYFINFLNLHSNSFSDYTLYFVGFTVESVVDPEAEYYQNLVLQNLSDRANELGIVGAQSSKSENWSLDKAESIRQDAKSGMSENLDIAKSFISGSSFGARAGSIQTAATAFGTIYNSVVSAVPAPLQALIIIIPTLAFIGWVIGRVQ